MTRSKRTPYVKAFTDLTRTGGLKMQDLGFFYALMEQSREENTSGIVSKNVLRSVAMERGFSSYRVSLERLMQAGLIWEVDGGYQLDWDGQMTAEQREQTRIKNAAEQRESRERKAQRDEKHETGDHSLCYKPYCDNATRWARGKKPKTDTVSGMTSGMTFKGKKLRSVPKEHNSSLRSEDGGASAPSSTASPVSSATAPQDDDSAPKKRKRNRIGETW